MSDVADIWINLNYEGWFAHFAANRGGRGITRDGKRILLKESNRRTVAYWHRVIIPRHFDSSARWRYHYQRRRRPYRRIKEELAAGKVVYLNGRRLEEEQITKGGRVDIVRSGQTEEQAEHPTAIFASENRAVATLRVPRHIVRRSRGSRPNQAAEIKRVTKAEKGRMVRIWKKTFLAGTRVFGSSIHAVRRRFVSRSAV